MELVKRMNLLFSSSSSSSEKMNLLTDIPIYYDYPSVEETEKAPIIATQLINYVLREQNSDLREIALNTLVDVCESCGDFQGIDFSPLLNSLSMFTVTEISSIIIVLGWSGNENYRKYIEQYAEIPELSKDVRNSLKDLDYFSGIENK